MQTFTLKPDEVVRIGTMQGPVIIRRGSGDNYRKVYVDAPPGISAVKGDREPVIPTGLTVLTTLLEPAHGGENPAVAARPVHDGG